MIRVVAFVVLDGGNIAELFVAEVVGMAVIEIALFEEGGCVEPNGIQNSCNKNYNHYSISCIHLLRSIYIYGVQEATESDNCMKWIKVSESTNVFGKT